MLIFPAPSEPPTSVNVTQDDEGLATLQVQWSPVDCIHQNGELTGYKVCHTNLATATELCTTTPDLSLNISVESVMNYSVRVAAVNNEGVGPYSNEVVVEVIAQGMLQPLYLLLLVAIKSLYLCIWNFLAPFLI